MIRLCCLRPSMHIHCLASVRLCHPGASTSIEELVRFDPFTGITVSFGVHSHSSKEGLFWIRNKSGILIQIWIPDLASEYGNQPYRGFHEQTVHPSSPGRWAQHQRVRHCVSQHPVGNADELRTVLRWRSGRSSALRSPQCFIRTADDCRTVLWWGSGRSSALRSPQCFIRTADDRRTVLRWRSGRSSALCSPQCFIRTADDCRTVLWWGSGRSSALRSPQCFIRTADDRRTVLRWRSGRSSALCSPQCFIRTADDCRAVLRRRSGRSSALRSPQCFIRTADDCRTVLWWGSGRSSALYTSRSLRSFARSEGNRQPLMSVGRLSGWRGGQ